MFGIGMPEMLLILAVALIVIGPKKLPDLAKSLGRALGEFKKATNELKDSLQVDTELKEVKTTFNELNRDLKDSRPAPPRQSEPGAADAEETETIVHDDKIQQDGDPVDELTSAFHRHDDALESEATTPDAKDQSTAGFSDPSTETRKA